MAEGVDGGFSAVYPILRALEESGRIRRGYFVSGLGAAQFALAGALERLRTFRDPDGGNGDDSPVHLLAAADPANPYGAALPWPRRGESDRRPFQRAAGAMVVLVDGRAVLYLDRGGTSLQTLPAFDDPDTADMALQALGELVADGRQLELVIGKIDGEPAGTSKWSETLLGAGFTKGYRGLVLRRPRAGAMIA
jgi:ATP-dependent Lhr-like helicase